MAMESGTSRFDALVAYADTVVSPDEPDPNSPDHDPSIVEGSPTTLSDFNRGIFAARLTAGVHGVSEQLIAQAIRPAQGNDPERRSGDAIEEIEIRVPTLARMAADTETEMVFADGGSCPHTTGAAGDAEDASAWVTAETRFALRLVARDYFNAAGRMLSINDGSLPFGGFFDNKLNRSNPDPRDKRCHFTHRIGRDIDINGVDSGGARINCTPKQVRDFGCSFDSVTKNGEQRRLFDLLEEYMGFQGGVRVIEASIHYRFPS